MGYFELIDQWLYPGQYGRFDSCSAAYPAFSSPVFFMKEDMNHEYSQEAVRFH
jgi:hypothetical protein